MQKRSLFEQEALLVEYYIIKSFYLTLDIEFLSPLAKSPLPDCS